MDRGRNSFGKKALAYFMSWVLVMGLIPLSAIAEDASDALTNNEASAVVADTNADSTDTDDPLASDVSGADDLLADGGQQTGLSQGKEDSDKTDGETEAIQSQSQKDDSTPEADDDSVLVAQRDDNPNALSGDVLDGCTVRIRNDRSPHCLCIQHNGDTTNRCAILYNIPDSSRFYLEKADEDSYYIRFYPQAYDTNYCTASGREKLAVEDTELFHDNYSDNNAVMHIQSGDDAYYKRFQIIPSGNGLYKIMSKESGKYWVLGDSDSDGVYDDNDRVHQNNDGLDWEIEIINDGGDTSQMGNTKPYETYAQTSATKAKYDSYSFSYNGSTVTSTNWMSALPDDTPITDLNIPGTHDTGTCQMKWKTFTTLEAQCQQLFIDDQLAAGVRYFDLRCNESYTKNGVESPRLNHTDDCADRVGDILTCDDVMTYVRNFLTDDASKNETVVFQISRQGDTNAYQIYLYWQSLVVKHPDWFYIGTRVPTLGEARGKIVLLSKIPDISNYDFIYNKPNGYRPNGLQAQWALDVRSTVDQGVYETAGDSVKVQDGSNYEVWCEDDYKVDAETKWSRSTTPSLNNAHAHRDEAIAKCKYAWNIIYTSCSALLDDQTTPISGARYTNHRLKSYFNESMTNYFDTSTTNGKYAGVVLMDFVDEQQCQFLFRQNFIMDMPKVDMPSPLKIDGSGTEQDPYHISNVDEWYHFCECSLVGAGNDAYWELDNDIATIGTSVGTIDHPFEGHFDGNGHTITMSLNHGEDATAPFRYIKGAEIHDLNLEGQVSGYDYSAGCVGVAMAGSTNTLTDIHVKNVSINTYETYAGGLLGNNTSANTTMLRCSSEVYFEEYLRAEQQVGGLCGWAEDGSSLTMEDCFAGVNCFIDIDNLSAVGCVDVTPAPTMKDVYYLITEDVLYEKTTRGNPTNNANKYATPVFADGEGDFEGYSIRKPVTVCTGDTYYIHAVLDDFKEEYRCTGHPINLDYRVIQIVDVTHDTDRWLEWADLVGPELTKGVHYTVKVFPQSANSFADVGEEIREEYVIEPGTYQLVIEGIPESGYTDSITKTFTVKGSMPEPDVEISLKVNRKSITVNQEKLEDAALKLCTPDELAEVYGGAKLKVWLDIHVTTVIAEVPASDVTLLQKRANALGSSLGEYATVMLYKQVGDGEAKRITELPKGMDAIQMSWTVPQNLRASGRNFGVMSVHDGEVLEHASDVSGNEVDFSVSKFSTFVLTHKDTKGTNSGSGTSKTSSAKTKLAKTGDEAVPMTLVLAMASAGMLCLAAERMLRRRRKL